MEFRRLLRHTLIALPVGAALVALCYFFVDRPVAFFVHDTHNFGLAEPLKLITYVPTTVEKWVPVMLVVLMIRRVWGPWRRWELALLLAGVSLVVAEQFKESIALVAGRTWPDTWVDNNPSLIQNDVFGFFPFHGGRGWESFPSGHTARTLAVVGVFWVAFPRWRWLCVVAAVPVPVGLLGMNYHFVGDVVGGGFVGAVVGAWAAYCGGMRGSDEDRTPRSGALIDSRESRQS